MKAKMSNSENSSTDPVQPLKECEEPIRNIIARVLKLEQERLYQRKPQLNEDVLRVIKEEIK